MEAAKWEVSVYKKDMLIDKLLFTKQKISTSKGFSASFLANVSARFMHYDGGDKVISFNYLSEKFIVHFNRNDRYYEGTNYVFVLHGKLKGKSQAV